MFYWKAYPIITSCRRCESILKANKANFIPCVGAQKIPQLVSLLIGWDLEFLAVLDNDSEGKRIANELSEKLSIEQDRILSLFQKKMTLLLRTCSHTTILTNYRA